VSLMCAGARRGVSARPGTTTVSNASKFHEGEAESMTTAVPTVVVTLCLAVTGCAGSGGSETSSDCSAQVRADGIVYTSHGHTEREASKHSVADRAECHDVGENAAGSVFPEQPEQVTTWSFRGYPPEKVVGVRFDADSFAVFVADSVPDAERANIFHELAKPSP
jgi:hypothetical protein